MHTQPFRSSSWSRRAILVLFTAVVPLACGGGGDSSSGGNPITSPPPTGGPVATNSVNIQGIAFNPSDILVSSGSTVSFTNQDGITHNVVFSNTSIAGAPDFTSGTESVVMPAAAGTYAYHCTHHAGMSGSVQVQ